MAVNMPACSKLRFPHVAGGKAGAQMEMHIAISAAGRRREIDGVIAETEYAEA